MHTRFPTKFCIEKNIDENVKSMMIPPMILQPIVENAISHGIIPALHFCTLTISAYSEDGSFVLSIADDGAGIPAGKLEFINDSINNKDFYQRENIGIINVSKRLKLIYHDHCELKIESSLGEGTIVRISIKL